MIDRFRDFARSLLTVLLLVVTSANAQTAQSAAPQGASAAGVHAAAQPAGPTGPQINIAEITKNVRTGTLALISRRRSPVGSTSLTGWKASCAARDCVIPS